jgi:hypothetical protein
VSAEIAFLGPEASFTAEAADRIAPDADRRAVPTIPEVFGLVRTGAAAAVRMGEPIDAYEPARADVVHQFRQMQVDGPPPIAFARTIADAIEARRLRPRYRVGFQARSLPWLRALLTDRVFRRVYGGFFGLRASRQPR